MQINFAYKYRIYPTKEQKIVLAKNFGCTRFVWNYFLNERKEFYLKNKEAIEEKRLKGRNYYDDAKKLTELKKEKGWLFDAGAQSLQATLKHLDTAYRAFFKKTHRFPRFKSKHGKQSFTIPQYFSIEDGKIKFIKFPEGIKVKEHRKLDGRFVVATLSKTPSGQYFVSVVVEKEIAQIEQSQSSIAIDLGLKDFAVCSDGKAFENHKHLKKKEKKLKHAQRLLSRSKKAGKNRQKRKLKVAILHRKITNARIGNLHKISNQITNKNQVVIIEDLNVKGMMQNHCLAKHIGDASWGEFVRQLEYKCKWKGRELVTIDRFFPSSKMCNSCGYINQDLNLQIREWECPQCNAKLDRDLNASRNILQQGLNLMSTAVGTTVESLGSCRQ